MPRRAILETGSCISSPKGGTVAAMDSPTPLRSRATNCSAPCFFYDASRQLAELLDAAKRSGRGQTMAENRGPYCAEHSLRILERERRSVRRRDTAMQAARHLGIGFRRLSRSGVPRSNRLRIARYFQKHYREIVYRGQIRQLPGGMYWESSLCGHDGGQNGGFWATATGWVRLHS